MEYSKLSPEEIQRKTFRADLWRGACRGALTTGTGTFSLFIAIRFFGADDTVKSLIASSPFMGMFFSLLLVSWLSKTGLKKSICGALPAFVCGIGLIGSAFANSLFAFTMCTVLAYISLNSMLPFLTSIYSDNYPHARRGAFFSRPLMVTVSVSVIFGYVASQILDLDLSLYPWVLALLGVCAFGKALAIYSMPSNPIENHNHNHPFENLKYIFQDRLFGYVLLTWFLMGFANLWVLPLRVDYVTSSSYGIQGSAFLVALLTLVVPEGFRFLFIPFWARLFDQMNFITLRIVLNLLFGLGIALYFVSENPWIIGSGAALIGAAYAGGSIAWTLWVTKFAPPGKAAAYMSVHVCLTGIRGTFGPAMGFWMVGLIGPIQIGFLSFFMMIIASVMLIPEIKHAQERLVPKTL